MLRGRPILRTKSNEKQGMDLGDARYSEKSGFHGGLCKISCLAGGGRRTQSLYNRGFLILSAGKSLL